MLWGRRTTPSSSAPARTVWSPPTGSRTTAGRYWCWRPSRRWAARCAATPSVHPDFVHDTFSAFYPLAAASRTLASFALEDHGLTWRHAPAVLGHPLPDGSWAMLHRDREVTASLMDEQHAGDGAAWLRAVLGLGPGRRFTGGGAAHAVPAPAGAARAAARPRRCGGRRLRQAGADTRHHSWARQLFGGDHPRLLLAGNAGHADIPLDAVGSGLMGVLMCMLGQTVGFPVPEGGAGRLTEALADRFTASGGEIRCSHPGRPGAGRAGPRGRRPHGRGARPCAPGHAVVADVIAPRLYGDLVAPRGPPDAHPRAMRRFELDPSTVKVDWALDGPVPWASPPPHAPGTVHVADSPEQLAESLAQVAARAVPADPFLLVGQMTTADPTRSPAGTESMWAYTHVPQSTRPRRRRRGGPRRLGPRRLRAVRRPHATPASSAWRPASAPGS